MQKFVVALHLLDNLGLTVRSSAQTGIVGTFGFIKDELGLAFPVFMQGSEVNASLPCVFPDFTSFREGDFEIHDRLVLEGYRVNSFLLLRGIIRCSVNQPIQCLVGLIVCADNVARFDHEGFTGEADVFLPWAGRFEQILVVNRYHGIAVVKTGPYLEDALALRVGIEIAAPNRQQQFLVSEDFLPPVLAVF